MAPILGSDKKLFKAFWNREQQCEPACSVLTSTIRLWLYWMTTCFATGNRVTERSDRSSKCFLKPTVVIAWTARPNADRVANWPKCRATRILRTKNILSLNQSISDLSIGTSTETWFTTLKERELASLLNVQNSRNVAYTFIESWSANLYRVLVANLIFCRNFECRNHVRVKIGPNLVSKTLVAGYSTFDVIPY